MPRPVPTFKGFAFGLLFSLVLFTGFLGSGYPYLQALAIVLASFLAGAYGYASWQAEALYRLRVERGFPYERTVEGSNLNVIIKIKNPSSIHLYRIEIADEVPWRSKLIVNPVFVSTIGPNETKTFVYTIRPMFGRHRWNQIRISVGDPFGLFRVKRTVRIISGISATPAWSEVEEWIKKEDLAGSSGIVSRTRRGLSLEFFEIRDYQLGDDVRKVVWSVTARTGKLMVREDLDEVRASFHIFIDLSSDSWVGPPGRSPADIMAKLAPALLNLAARSGGIAGFTVFYGDGWRSYGPSRASETFEKLVAMLSVMSPEDSRSRTVLRKALEEAMLRAEDRQLLILLGPGALGGIAWSEIAKISSKIRDAFIGIIVPWGDDEVSKAISKLEEDVFKSKRDETKKLRLRMSLIRNPFIAWEVIWNVLEH